MSARANLDHAAELWRTWAALGLRHVSVSPGSRSAPLTIAAARRTDLKAYVHVDERSGAFFGLGLSKGSGLPAALVCTSGTAVANYLPGVWEACLSKVPLLIVTADRPPELRDCGAAQTIRQNGIFGAAVRASFETSLPADSADSLAAWRAVAMRAWTVAVTEQGPVHINVPFQEPLLPAYDERSQPPLARVSVHTGKMRLSLADEATLRERLMSARRLLLICGPQQATSELKAQIDKWAAAWRVPVLADVASGFRFGAQSGSVITAYDAILRLGMEAPDVVIHTGLLPTSKTLQQWYTAPGIAHIAVDSMARYSDPHHVAESVYVTSLGAFFSCLPAEPIASRFYFDTWQRAEAAARKALPAVLANAISASEAAFGASLASIVPAGAALFLSNSMPIRDAEFFSGPSVADVAVFTNRGANGIDGILSTAAGAAASTGRTLVAVVGDLAFLHDSAGLAAAIEAGIQGVIVVVNNNGGAIFSHLPAKEHADIFEKYFTTPQAADIQAVAASRHISYVRADSTQLAKQAVGDALASRKLTVVEFVVDLGANAAEHPQLWKRWAQELAAWV